MASLILLIIFGLGVSYFATQNTGTVHILIGNYLLSNIPLYIIVVGSLLLGVFISFLVSFVNSISTFFALHGKDAALKHLQETIDTLQAEKHDLEVKIASLEKKSSSTETITKEKQETKEEPSMLERIKHSLTVSPQRI